MGVSKESVSVAFSESIASHTAPSSPVCSEGGSLQAWLAMMTQNQARADEKAEQFRRKLLRKKRSKNRKKCSFVMKQLRKKRSIDRKLLRKKRSINRKKFSSVGRKPLDVRELMRRKFF